MKGKRVEASRGSLYLRGRNKEENKKNKKCKLSVCVLVAEVAKIFHIQSLRGGAAVMCVTETNE